MSLTPTKQIPLGFRAPDFELIDSVTDEKYTIRDFQSPNGVVFMFISNHCPFVKHVIVQLVKLAEDYMDKGIAFVAISSNDVKKYPEDGPAKMKALSKKLKFPFPYLYDETQEVAKAYSAECTPDFSIFDKNLRCVYRGQLDDSRPGNARRVTGDDIRNALNAMLEGRTINADQKPSVGCNIKWK